MSLVFDYEPLALMTLGEISRKGSCACQAVKGSGGVGQSAESESVFARWFDTLGGDAFVGP